MFLDGMFETYNTRLPLDGYSSVKNKGCNNIMNNMGLEGALLHHTLCLGLVRCSDLISRGQLSSLITNYRLITSTYPAIIVHIYSDSL